MDETLSNSVVLLERSPWGADLLGMLYKLQMNWMWGSRVPAARGMGPRAATVPLQRNGSSWDRSLLGKEGLLLICNAIKESDKMYIFVGKTVFFFFFKIGICSFGVSSPAIHIQEWPKCPLTIKPLRSNPGASAIMKIMVPSSSASSPEGWGKGREHRGNRKSANSMIMSLPLPTATESCN